MNLLRKLDSISRKLENNMLNRQTNEQKPETSVIKTNEKKSNRRDALDLNILVTTQLLLIKNHIEITTFKYLFMVEKRTREMQQVGYKSLLKIGQSNSDIMTNHIKQLNMNINQSNNVKDDLLFRTKSELDKTRRVNKLKEQITSELEKIIFKIIKDLQDALRTRKANKEKKLEDKMVEKKTPVTYSPVIKHHKKTNRQISDDESISESFIFVLSKGSLETDKRFVKLIQQTLKDIECYSDPVIVRMGIQFILAKKYIDDIIFLKQKALDKKCLIT